MREGRRTQQKHKTNAGKEEPRYVIDFSNLVLERKCSIDDLIRPTCFDFVSSVEYCFNLGLNPQSSIVDLEQVT